MNEIYSILTLHFIIFYNVIRRKERTDYAIIDIRDIFTNNKFQKKLLLKFEISVNNNPSIFYCHYLKKLYIIYKKIAHVTIFFTTFVSNLPFPSPISFKKIKLIPFFSLKKKLPDPSIFILRKKYFQRSVTSSHLELVDLTGVFESEFKFHTNSIVEIPGECRCYSLSVDVC